MLKIKVVIIKVDGYLVTIAVNDNSPQKNIPSLVKKTTALFGLVVFIS